MMHRARVYQTVKSSNGEFVLLDADGVVEHTQEHQQGYEGIFGKCKAYFDYDASYNTKKKQESAATKYIKKAIKEVIGCVGCDADQLCISISNGFNPAKDKWVNSVHIVVNDGAVYDSGAEVLDVLSNDMTCDRSVYKSAGKRQLFRMVGCAKEGQDRPFIRVDSELNVIETTSDNIRETLVSLDCPDIKIVKAVVADGKEPIEMKWFKNKMPEEANAFKYVSQVVRGTAKITNLKRTKPLFCKYCHVRHDNDNTGYLLTLANKSTFYGCIRQTDRSCKMECVKGAPTGAFNKLMSAIETQTLLHPSAKSDIEAAFVATGFEIKKCDERYCSDIPEFKRTMVDQTHSLVGIRANMGSGKSRANVRAVEELLKRKPNAKILVISMRISLAETYSKNYKGFLCYRDVKQQKLTSNKLICQLDSLHRVSWKPNAGEDFVADMVILDECDQALNHRTATTYMGSTHAGMNIKMFEYLINTAKQVVCMSANLTAVDMTRISNMRDTIDTGIVFLNSNVPIKQDIRITTNWADIILELKDNLTNNERSYVACNGGSGRLKEIQKMLKAHKPKAKILLICQDTLGREEVKNAINSPKLYWGLYDVILASPSVQGGVSFDLTNVFNHVYGMFGNGSNSSADASQMLRRVRSPMSNRIMVSFESYNGSHITDRQELIDHIVANRQGVFDNLRACTNYEINRDGVTVFKQGTFFQQYLDLTIEANKDRYKWVDNFVQHQLLYGNTVGLYATMTLEDEARADHAVKVKAVETDRKVAKAELKQERAVDLNNAASINNETANALKKKMDVEPLTEVEMDQVRKHTLNRLYSMPYDAKGVDWYLKYNDQKIIKVFNNLKHYYAKNRTLNEGLATVLENEWKREMKLRSVVIDAKEGVCAAAGVDAVTAATLSRTYSGKRHKMLIDWITTIGYNVFEGKTNVSGSDMKERLGLIHDKDFVICKKLIDLLGKDRRKIKGVSALEQTDKSFVKNMLRFINGSLMDEFGCKIVKTSTSRHNIQYKLQMKYVEDGTFQSKSNTGKCKPCTPILAEAEPMHVEDQMALLLAMDA